MNHTLKVATFNLFNFIEPPNAFYEFDNIYTDSEWQKKCTWTVNQLQRIQADIVGFQEIFSSRALEKICHASGLVNFTTVEQPSIESDYVHFKPVTGLASKHPILRSQGLVVEKHTRLALGLPSAFNYSRMPLHAVVKTPTLGTIDVVVVHLKSQRPMDVDNPENHYSRYSDEFIGSLKSSQQRNEEAMALRHQLRQIKSRFDRPMILMGDMNQNLTSPSIQCLVEPSLTEQTQVERKKLYLSDSWQLSSPTSSRKPSHYYGEQGNTLDYILLSQEFSSYLVQHKTLDKHLVQPNYDEDSMSSDHGIVVASINN
ncbi:endonuclease/exonuclease/phosphatase family protein [Vibrio sp. S9_S30]|uniref:endonuclease/exonuclease/phosphatase family protein n=1 Tax=Vibrio sp. S9_S30 TaxID=2720226 RepID=UPI00168155D5|nr:endonuclease/exonuclease/phosphatase family protein [Vibrio sp. S9_S30]MBD1557619.1 endonuclease/exonuclease/phosphatase family protein [Vibrio sp. S9_S30]